MNKPIIKKILLLAALLLMVGKVFSQDIEPRRWTPLPLGTQVIGSGYGFTDATIYFDPILQAEDVSMQLHAAVVSYVQPFRIGNKLARVDVTIPHIFARWNGLLSGKPTTLNRQGFADPRIRMSLNLIGPKAVAKKEMLAYMKANPVNTMLGVSLAVTVPIGQYAEDRLINLGYNRFVIRPQIGMVHSWRRWSFELTTSVFFFTTNTNFYNNQVKKQKPLFAIQSHLIHRFKNRMWISASLGLGSGAASTIDNVYRDDARGDILAALSFGLPITKTQAIKLSYLRTETYKAIGSDGNSLGLGWSLAF